MKRLVTLAACLAMLTFTGCANGILGGGLFSSGCDNGCNSSPSLLGGNGLLSDGPIRQFLRGDACDSCNAAAGQVAPGYGVPTCDACGSAVGNAPLGSDPYAFPTGSVNAFPGTINQGQPTTSFYPSDAGVSLGQPIFHDSGIAPIDSGAITGAAGAFDSIDNGLSEPPTGININ